MVLGEGHGPGVEPHVDDLERALHALAALGAGKADVVDERAVVVGQLATRELGQLGERPHAVHVPGRTPPDRQRSPPVALARERPVDVAPQPLAEAPVLDVLGVPAHGLVGGQQAVAQARGGDVPRGLGVVEQRGAAAPAVGIGVLVGLRAPQPPARAQVLDQVGVGVLDKPPGERPDALVVGAVGAHRVDHLEPVLLAQAVVVLAEGDGRVHQARALLGRDEVGRQHGVPAFAIGLGADEVERGLIAGADQLGPREAVEHLGALAQHRLGSRLGHHQLGPSAGRAGAHVGHLRVDGHRRVGDQRPRRGGPHQQLRVGGQRSGPTAHGQAHIDRGVGDVAVAQRHLVGGQRRPAPGAVGDDLVALVEQALVIDLAQRPPDRLDVALIQRAVGVVEVDPEADALGQPLPLLHVGEHRLPAAGVERGDPVGLDLVLGGDPQLLLDCDLDRQAVAVPPPLALDPVTAHGLVARVDVLEHPRQHVVRARRPVGGRRPLVEHPRLGVGAAAQRLGEHVALAPAGQHLELELGQRQLGVDGTVGHRRRF